MFVKEAKEFYKNKMGGGRNSLELSKAAEHLFFSYHLQEDPVGVCQQGRPSKVKTLSVPAAAEAPESLVLPRVPLCEEPQLKQVLRDEIIKIYQLFLKFFNKLKSPVRHSAQTYSLKVLSIASQNYHGCPGC